MVEITVFFLLNVTTSIELNAMEHFCSIILSWVRECKAMIQEEAKKKFDERRPKQYNFFVVVFVAWEEAVKWNGKTGKNEIKIHISRTKNEVKPIEFSRNESKKMLVWIDAKWQNMNTFFFLFTIYIQINWMCLVLSLNV